MKNVLVGLIITIAAAPSIFAGNYNDAGCGLGSLAWKENTPSHQILAATTNDLISPQTSAITSGTSGCGSGGMTKAMIEQQKFVAVNFRTLSRDLAVGQGEYAAALASLMGCQKEAMVDFLTFAKLHYEELIPNAKTSADEMLQNLRLQMLGDPAILRVCTI